MPDDLDFDDGYDELTGSFVYHYRSPRQPTRLRLEVRFEQFRAVA